MSSNNTTSIVTTLRDSDSIIVILDLVKQRFVIYLPLVFTILGTIGFIGNVFTFLQPTLRLNTCCIYLLCASVIDVINIYINLLPNYLYSEVPSLLSIIFVSGICKLKLFGLVFLPQLSENLLILSSIDRYACTCGLNSPIRHIRQLKMAPYLIGIVVIISGVMSLYAPILHDIDPIFGCISMYPTINSIFYVGVHGLMTALVMSLFVLLTYRNARLSRQRVGGAPNGNHDRTRNQFLTLIITQVLTTSFFILQWIFFYIYFIVTQYDNKSPEQWAIDFFSLSITNNLYYMINVKSFYLSTLTSRLFRNTLINALRKLIFKHQQRQDLTKNTISMNVTRTRRQNETRNVI